MKCLKYMSGLSLALLLMIVAGCSTQQFTFGDRGVETRGVETRGVGTLRYLGDQPFTHGGAWQVYDVNIAQICGDASKVGMVSYTYTASNILVALATLGIYAPRYAEVYCR